MRLTSVHIGSSRVDASITFPEYSPKVKPGPFDHGPDPVFAHDGGFKQGTRKQVWSQITNPAPHHELTQVNWASSGKSGYASPNGARYPKMSPIKKNHTNCSKRELELFGGRPVSPTRARGGGGGGGPGKAEGLGHYDLMSRPSRDGSFGDAGHDRVYKSWRDSVARGKNTGTGTHDGGVKHTAGPRGRVTGVGLHSGNIDLALDGF